MTSKRILMCLLACPALTAAASAVDERPAWLSRGNTVQIVGLPKPLKVNERAKVIKSGGGFRSGDQVTVKQIDGDKVTVEQKILYKYQPDKKEWIKGVPKSVLISLHLDDKYNNRTGTVLHHRDNEPGRCVVNFKTEQYTWSKSFEYKHLKPVGIFTPNCEVKLVGLKDNAEWNNRTCIFKDDAPTPGWCTVHKFTDNPELETQVRYMNLKPVVGVDYNAPSLQKRDSKKDKESPSRRSSCSARPTPSPVSRSQDSRKRAPASTSPPQPFPSLNPGVNTMPGYGHAVEHSTKRAKHVPLFPLPGDDCKDQIGVKDSKRRDNNDGARMKGAHRPNMGHRNNYRRNDIEIRDRRDRKELWAIDARGDLHGRRRMLSQAALQEPRNSEEYRLRRRARRRRRLLSQASQEKRQQELRNCEEYRLLRTMLNRHRRL